jgi:CHAT domain-containing protein
MWWQKLYLQLLVLQLKLGRPRRPEREFALLQRIIVLDATVHVLEKHLRAMLLGNVSVILQERAALKPKAEAESFLDVALIFTEEAASIFQEEFDAATDVSRQASVAVDYARAQLNRGIILEILAERHMDAENSERMQASLDAYDQASRIFGSAKEEKDVAIDYARVQMNKGNLLHLRAERATGSKPDELATEALACYEDALHYFEGGSREHAIALMNKAGMLRLQGRRAGVEKARVLYQQVVESYTEIQHRLDPKSLELALLSLDMADALFDSARIAAGVEAVALLQRAIAAYDLTLSNLDVSAQARYYALAQDGKGITLSALAERREEQEALSLLGRAIHCFDEALSNQLTSGMLPQYAATQQNKGNALLKLAERQDAAKAREALEAALVCYQQAIDCYRQARISPQFASALQNQANVLSELARLHSGADAFRLLTSAISNYDQALEIYQRSTSVSQYGEIQQNKGNALIWLAKYSPLEARLHRVEQALACYTEALEVFPPLLAPQKHRTAALWLARAYLALWREHPPESAEAASRLAQAWKVALSGREAARLLESLAPSLEFRQAEWVENAAFYATAAAIRAAQGDISEAVLWLEAGRARGLTEAQNRRRIDISMLTPDERSEYTTCVNALLDLETRSRQRGNVQDALALVEEASAKNDELTRLIERFRQTYPVFLPENQQSVAQLTRVLQADEVLIYLIPQPYATLVLFVSPFQAPLAQWLPLTEDELFALAVQQDADGYNRRGYLPAIMGLQDEALDQALDVLLPLLGKQVMRPVVQQARVMGARRVILVPGGLFAALPLHAAAYTPLLPVDIPTAPDGLRYACDDLLITCTPSGTAYLYAYARQKPCLSLTSGFVVGNPMLVPDGHPWDHRVRGYLPYAEREARSVAARMRLAGLSVRKVNGAGASRQAILAGLAGADVVHLAMHAIFDADDPLSSALLAAAGEKILVRDLLDARQIALEHVRLAVLSACQSAIGDFEQQKEEALGIFGALLAAGVAGVIGSLWPVNDYHTALLMTVLTEHYLQGQAPAIALQLALKQFRMQTDEQARQSAGLAPRPGQEHGEDARALTLLRRYIPGEEVDQDRPSSVRNVAREHPVHWAAFVYYGA